MATDASQPLTEGAHSKSSTISSELSITGNVTSTGGIHLDGQVQGEILCASLVLGENSELKGSAVAGEVLISGRLTGSVRARQVRLEAGSHVEGDLLYQSLVIEQGAFFDGTSRHSDDPLSSQQGSLGIVGDVVHSVAPSILSNRPPTAVIATAGEGAHPKKVYPISPMDEARSE